MSNKSYTEEQVIELLLAYKLSDQLYSVEEVKSQISLTKFTANLEQATNWLQKVSTSTVKERSEEWFTTRDRDFQRVLRRKHPNKSQQEIYEIEILKILK